MKKLYSLMLTVLFVGLTFLAQAQDTIVAWSFNFGDVTSISAASLTATDGIAANKGVSLVSTSMGTTSFGYTASNSSIYTNNWHAQAGMERYWLIGPISFEGFNSDMEIQYQAWGTATGPKTFNYEVKIGKDGEWQTGGSYNLTTTKKTVIGPLKLPHEMLANQKEVYFRLVVANNTPISSGDTIAVNGNSRLAEIYVTGKAGAVTEKTATPEFNPEARTFTDPFDMKIFCKTPDATIYYTMDGTTPTDSTAEKYDGNLIRIDTTTTVKAFAVAEGMEPSEVAEVTYTYVAPAKPSVQFLSLKDGGTYANPIHLEVAVENFTICNAGEGDGYLKFESPIIDEFAKATGLDTMIGLKNPVFCDQFMFETMSSFPIVVEPGKYTITASLVGKDSAEFTPAIAQTITVTIINPAIETTSPDTLICIAPKKPVIAGVTGVGLIDSIMVASTSADFMLIDVQTYDMGYRLYFHPDSISLFAVMYMGSEDTTVFADLYFISGEISEKIVMNYGLDWDTLPAPVFSVPEGTYTEPQTVELTVDDPIAAIYYTLDGTDPDTNDAAIYYEEPIEITETTIVKAYAWSPYAYSSPVVVAKYVIDTTSTGIAAFSTDMQVYPNPATSYVKVDLGQASAQHVEVIGVNGQVVYTAENQGNNFTISTNNFSNGIYLIRVITTDNKMIVNKIVKM